MPKPIIYFLDDQESQQKTLSWDLRDLFGEDYAIAALPLSNQMEEYNSYVDNPEVIGLLVDQRLRETGVITDFSGVDLARYLRAIYTEMPIYIVTGYDPDEQIEGAESGAADDVVHKSELRAGTPKSLRFKERFLRRAGRYQEAMTEKQRRFRELLSKSLNETITEEEKGQLAELDTARLLPTHAAEACEVSRLQNDIAALEDVLKKIPPEKPEPDA